MQAQPTIFRRAQLPSILGISKSTIDRLRSAGDFPAPFFLGQQALGFLRTEVEEWVSKRPRAVH